MNKAPLSSIAVRIAMFGCGTMGGAMLSRWLACGLDPAQVTVIRKSGKSPALNVAAYKNARGMLPADIVLIAIKPQQFAALKPALAPLVGPQTLVASIMAGIPMERLSAAFPDADAIVRLMPNMPVAHGQGVIAQLGSGGAHARTLSRMLGVLGHVQLTADERSFDLVTALAGCGPAFTYRFAAALAAAGERLGLAPDDADLLARLTVSGAGTAIAQSPQPLSELAAAVASPGGMTQAGLDVLDADGVLIQLLTDTLRAARDRGADLAALAAD